MATIPKTLDEVIKGAVDGTLGVLPSDTDPDITSALKGVASFDGFVNTLKLQTGLDDENVNRAASTTVFAALEKAGLDPSSWLLTLPPLDRAKIKYGPEEYETARRFLGSWSKVQFASFVIMTLSSIAIVALGLGPALTAARLAISALKAGQGLAVAAQAFDIAKVLALPRLIIPGIIGALATAANWIAGTQVTATGDLTTYVRTTLAQNVAKEQEAEARARAAAAGLFPGATFGAPTATTLTRDQISSSAKPKLFIGTVFGDKVADVPRFIRAVDDKITDEEDLIQDVQINMTRWLAALPGRLGYEIQIKNGPFDEDGNKKQGTWATLNLYFLKPGAPRIFLQEVLLGPLDPIQYFPESARVKQIQFQIPGLVTPEQLRARKLTPEMLMTVDATGNVILDVVRGPSQKPAVMTPAPVSLPAPVAPVIQTPTPSPAPVAPPISPSAAQQASVALAQAQAALAAPTPANLEAASAALKVASAALPPAPAAPKPAEFPLGFSRGDTFFVDSTKTGGAGLNVRGAGGVAANILRKVPDGTTGSIIGLYGPQDGFTWFNVVIDGTNGYVAGEFLTRR